VTDDQDPDEAKANQDPGRTGGRSVVNLGRLRLRRQSPVPGEAEASTARPTTSVDARGATGVQVGENNTQINYIYDRRTWTDQVAPSPLVDVAGVIQSPYRGLGAFEERDSPFFFGRKDATRDLLAKMSSHLGAPALIVVSGVSGAGKSSLLRAGVLPAMRGTGLPGAPGSATWPCLVVTPGRDPLSELAMRVAPLVPTDAASLRQRFADDPTDFALIAGQIAESSDRRMLLVVDQFEQVFTQCSDDDQRKAFVTALHAAADAPVALVVFVVRADFEARCADYPELVDAVRDRYLVTPMTRRQLELAITEPAKAAGSRVDDDLVNMLVRDVLTGVAGPPSGALPLLSHALDQAWRRREGHELTALDYDLAGGIEGAVAKSAKRAYKDLTPAQKTAARQVFIRLTATNSDGVDTADRVALAELTNGKNAANVRAVLDAFVKERLLTLAAGTVEISHEVLLTAWPLLRDTWLVDTHGDRVVRTRLRNAAADWSRTGKDPSYLYAGSLLVTAANIAKRVAREPARQSPLSDDELAFLRASERAHRRRRRARQGVLAFLMVLVVGLAAVAIVAYRSDQEAVRQRDLAVAGQLVSQSQNLGGVDPTAARLDSMAAWGLMPSADTRYAMLAAAAHPLRRIIDVHNGGDAITSLAFAGDSKTLVTADVFGTAPVWDVATGRQVGQLGRNTDNHSRIWSVAISRDGRTMATVSEDGTVTLQDAVTGRQLGQPLPAPPAPPTTNVTFGSDGKTLATVGLDDTVRVWNLATRRQVGPAPTATTGAFHSVALSPDGSKMAFYDNSGAIRLWDVATGQPIAQPLATSVAAGPQAVAFSPDGTTLAVVGGAGAVRLVDVATGAQIGRPFTVAGGLVNSVAFSPDGTVVAVVSDDGTVRLMSVATGSQIGSTLAGRPNNVLWVAFSPDGMTLAVAGLDGTVQLWSVAIGRGVGQSLGETVSSVAVSPDGRTMATATQGGRVRLWNVATGEQIGQPFEGIAAPTSASVAFSPDGRTLAVAGDDGQARLWNVATGRQVAQFGDGKFGIESVEFGPGGSTLVTGGIDGIARLWNVATGRQIQQFVESIPYPINSMSLSPDGRTLAVARDQRPAELWDVTTGRRTIQLGDDSAKSVAVSPDGKTLAVGGDDGTTRLWDAATGKQIGRTLADYTGGVTSVAFSPDGRTLAVASANGPPVLWDVAAGRQIGRPLASGTGAVYGLAFTPDGNTLATAGIGAARLWNVDYIVDVLPRLCRAVGGSFTPDMWAKYVPQGTEYRKVCP
jgi:WD40 repeat protein